MASVPPTADVPVASSSAPGALTDPASNPKPVAVSSTPTPGGWAPPPGAVPSLGSPVASTVNPSLTSGTSGSNSDTSTASGTNATSVPNSNVSTSNGPMATPPSDAVPSLGASLPPVVSAPPPTNTVTSSVINTVSTPAAPAPATQVISSTSPISTGVTQVPRAISANPLVSKVGLRNAVVTGQTWFPTTCADLAPPSVQVAANWASDSSVLTAAAVAKSALLWGNGTTITYGYIVGASTPNQQTKIDTIMTTFITSNVNVVLTKIPMPSDSTSPSPTIRISCSAGYAATSFYSYSQGWTADQVKTNILNVYNAGDVSNFTQVDQSSLMMYYMPSQLSLSGQNVPVNSGPSTRDISWLRVNYPGSSASASLSSDLAILGVTGDTLTAMLTAPLPIVRTQLATWQAAQLIQSAKAAQRAPPTVGGPSPTRPARDVDDDPPPIPQPNIKAETGNFLGSIVKSFRQVFSPGGGQIFTLQFPGRFLQSSQYAWDTTSAGIYGQLVKPIAVNESEFRLVDQLYDVADVVAAPNGVSLSQVYEQLLNNLVPVSSNTNLAELQDEIRRWLLTEVKASSWIQRLVDSQHSNGSTTDIATKVSDAGTINRIELSNTLMQDYLTSKQSWETERDQMMEDALKAANSAEALSAVSRKLAHTTATRKAQLAAKYTDAIVRGYTHNVREYISYLDVKTTAEALQDAKDALREAAASSLDGSLKVYPVQLSPIDWFEGLSTSFTSEDLTTNADSILQQINTKSQQLDVLNQQLVALAFGQKGDVDALEAEVTAAQQSVDTQLTNLSMTYTNNVIAMAKTCLDKQGDLDPDQLTNVGSALGLDAQTIQQLGEDMGKTAQAQQALTDASRTYARALASYALAQATDSKQQQETIRQQITSLTSEIDVLTSKYQALNQVGQRPTPPPTVPTTDLAEEPLMPTTNNNAGGSRWQDIVMHHIVQSDYSKQEDKAFGSTTSMTCNLWALSGSGELTMSGAEASSQTTKMKNEVWVGFRATLVTVDRGGWFQPQFFKQSAGYYHISRNTFWSRYPPGIATTTQLKDAGESAFDAVNTGLLPAFPQAIIICKDITIKISNDTTSVATSSVNMQSTAAASGGVLCFSFSSSDSSSSSENTYSFKQCSDGCVIRIPGPQVLGYILQLTENDATRDLPSNLANLFVPPVDVGISEDIPKARGGISPPARGIQDVPVIAKGQMFEQIDSILSKTDLPARTVLNVRSAVQKELDVMSADVAARIREA
ncbi:hypothetical protein EUX98_g723 [Antrodiella citrinella]|uniref:Uncharacterized protein n=1 Tax=Antrodiella citrinella TaxID=2447956 RepID=A0A4S4N6C6_9APHY|nr:hypothetical protein EUX98_g723 [Antrodiella citrinella]